jgi:hypothetical protein
MVTRTGHKKPPAERAEFHNEDKPSFLVLSVVACQVVLVDNPLEALVGLELRV